MSRNYGEQIENAERVYSPERPGHRNIPFIIQKRAATQLQTRLRYMNTEGDYCN